MCNLDFCRNFAVRFCAWLAYAHVCRVYGVKTNYCRYLKNILLNREIQNGIATALICLATVGGFMILTDDGGKPTLSSVSVSNSHFGQSSYRGETGYSVASGSGVPVVSHSTLGHSVSGGSGLSGSTRGIGLSASSGSSVSVGMIGHTTHISGSAFGGGGGVYSGGGGSGSAGGSGSSGLSGGTGGMVAMAMPMPGRVGDVSVSKGMMGAAPMSDPAPGVYNGDAPGDITGAENGVLDNPIITSYGQPIGDVLWPLLLMAIVYMVFRSKSYRNKTEI